MELLDEISAKGYAIADVGSVEAYRELSRKFGDLWFEAEITLKEGRQYGAHNPRALDFHTDAPTANLVGWYAKVPGAPTLLKDLSEISIDEATVTSLRHVKCACPATDRKNFSHHPVFDSEGNKARFYYAPWFVQREKALPEHQAALVKFEKALLPITIQSVTLKPGQALYVDNGRMLHGRNAIPEDSKRLLIRHWVANLK